jgi:Bacteriophage T4-like portal protein (Gp20)
MAWIDNLRQLFTRIPVEPLGSENSTQTTSPLAQYYFDKLQLASDRIKKYKDYADMQNDTLISGALDCYADESTLFDRVEGASIWVESDNAEVEGELRKLFDILEVEDIIFGTARYLACYGDNFIARSTQRLEKGWLAWSSWMPKMLSAK